MKKTFKYMTEHPKTTIGGVVILAATVMLWVGKIDSTAFLSVLGVAGAWIGFAANDSSTSNDKNNGEQK